MLLCVFVVVGSLATNGLNEVVEGLLLLVEVVIALINVVDVEGVVVVCFKVVVAFAVVVVIVVVESVVVLGVGGG